MKSKFILSFILITFIYHYKMGAQWIYLLNEDFETTPPDTIPEGWTVIDGNNDGEKWKVKEIAGNHQAVYKKEISNYRTYNEELWTPKINTSEIIELRFKYWFYFLVYEIGEKYRIHFRKKIGNSWSEWIQLKVYTSNTSGIDSFDLTNHLPCDSIQFRFFYSDSTSPSPWEGECRCDDVILKGKSLNISEIPFKENNSLIYVFDVTGKEIKKIFEKNNIHQKIKPGIYFISLKSKKFKDANFKKIIKLF